MASTMPKWKLADFIQILNKLNDIDYYDQESRDKGLEYLREGEDKSPMADRGNPKVRMVMPGRWVFQAAPGAQDLIQRLKSLLRIRNGTVSNKEMQESFCAFNELKLEFQKRCFDDTYRFSKALPEIERDFVMHWG